MPARIAAIVWLFAATATGSVVAGDDSTFEHRVRPVLVEHCYPCHSEAAKKSKGGLRLDGRAHLLAGGDSGPAIVPGKPAESRLLDAIKYGNLDLQMPPNGKLPAKAIADVEAWIATGAPWPGDQSKSGVKESFDLAKRKAGHWAWKTVTSPAVPEVKNTAWPRDVVDRFVLAKLEAAGFAPAQAADKSVWLRRVSFAITGLPPTPAEVKAYLADDRPNAKEIVVDRLLASPAYGERWARHWLDLVRYAETRGHEFDAEIANAWQYRDYVVRAINADVPYDRFIVEQIAGDCVPKPRLDPKTGANESIVGTAFWHLGEEVHSPVDIRQDQADRYDNRIDVLTKTVLGLTVSCARCHDHKFDAISTKDYYALFGLLQGSSYRQVRVDGWQANRAAAAELAESRARIHRDAALTIRAKKTAYEPALVAWLAAAKVVIDYANPKPGDFLPDDVTFELRRPGDVRVTPHRVETRGVAAFDSFWANLTSAPGTMKEFGALGRSMRAGMTLRTPSFPLERNRIHVLVRGGGTIYAAVAGHAVIQGPLHGSLVKSIPNDGAFRWVTLPLDGYRGLRLHVEMTADPKTDFAVAMIAQSDGNPPSVPPAAIETPKLTAALVTNLQQAEEAIAKKVVRESRLAPALFDGSPVDDAVFIRGNPRSPGEVVPHRGLEALDGPDRIAHTSGSGRLELATQWTDASRNPFVARVAVNRIWHHLFGGGLVASVDNFGALGEAPTHPELLDHLATEFVRDGWSSKRMIRRLVMTSTFATSSNGPETESAVRLWSKFRMKRLEGEAIRDAILAASGRLDRTLGGEPVPIPLTPFLDGRGRPGTSGPVDGHGRRSLYLSVRRNFLSPFMLAFDTPIPFSTVGRRQVSNVPAQALILMNDPFVHGQAELWGKRLAANAGPIDDRIRTMYLTCFARPPSSLELGSCRTLIGGRATDVAAWTELSHALFNVKEFVFVP